MSIQEPTGPAGSAARVQRLVPLILALLLIGGSAYAQDATPSATPLEELSRQCPAEANLRDCQSILPGCQAAVDRAQKLVPTPLKPALLATPLLRLARCYQYEDQAGRAKAVLNQAKGPFQEFIQSTPASVAVAEMAELIAETLADSEKPDEATHVLELGLACAKRTRPQDPLVAAIYLQSLVPLLIARKSASSAQTLVEEALSTLSAKGGDQRVAEVKLKYCRALLRSAEGRQDLAHEEVRFALGLIEKGFFPDYRTHSKVLRLLIEGLLQSDRSAQAAPRLLQLDIVLAGRQEPSNEDLRWARATTLEVLEQTENFRSLEDHVRNQLNAEARLSAETAQTGVLQLIMARLLRARGKAAAAEAWAQRGLAAIMADPDRDDRETSMAQFTLGVVLYDLGRYSEAEPLLREAYKLVNKNKHITQTRRAYIKLYWSLALHGLGSYRDSLGLLKDVALNHRKNSFLGATAALGLTWVFSQQGDYVEAEKFLAVARGILDDKGFPEPLLEVTICGEYLFFAQFALGQYVRAEAEQLKLLKQVEQAQNARGGEISLQSPLRYGLAATMLAKGNAVEAERNLRLALSLEENKTGSPHPRYFRILKYLADTLTAQGRPAEAEPLVRRALIHAELRLPYNHPDLAYQYGQLGDLMRTQGRYQEAEQYYRRVLSIFKDKLPHQHPALAMSLGNLAVVLSEQAKYPEANQLMQATLQMTIGITPTAHPLLGYILSNWAEIQLLHGEFSQAIRSYEAILGVWQKALPANHPDLAGTLHGLGSAALGLGDLKQAVKSWQQAGEIREGQVRLTASDDRVRTLLRELRTEEEALYGLLVTHSNDRALRELALQTVLLRKGRAADAGAVANFIVHQNLSSPKLKEQFAEWQDLRAQYEFLLYRGPDNQELQSYESNLRALAERAAALENSLAVALPQIREHQPPMPDQIIPQVAAQLQGDAALIEFLYARPYQFRARDQSPRWQEPHYLALLLFSDRRIRAVDLGAASQIDDALRQMLAAIQQPAYAPLSAAQAAYQRVFAPLRPHLKGIQYLNLSPDGLLHLIPFAALHDGTDYLLGQYHCRYLTSGRDLLRKSAKVDTAVPLIVADPDFAARITTESSAPPQKPSLRGGLYGQLGGFAALPGARQEARLIGELLSVEPRLGRSATEELIRGSQSPRLLHIATHGLFLPDRAQEQPILLASRGLSRKSVQVVSPQGGMVLPEDSNPLSRSALVLAGAANAPQAANAGSDGLLTADEVRSLNLLGTQLVVLSACDTGKGALAAGEGVYGLRRAFLIAGAETMVTSLWPIADQATEQLMKGFYQNMVHSHRSRLLALEEAMQAVRKIYDHPYYWAPFLLIGQDGPLRSPH